ncbi:T-complex protein 1 subunit eta [Candidozyma auris]|nr:T-complex protein 1 subunit eta [[Candida] auris]
MAFSNQTPTIVVLKEGTDASQGKGQILNNINACLAIQETLKPTLGPFGSDILIKSSNGKTTISNDGATILKLLDIVHPAAKMLVDISRAQDAEVGDGTTSVTVLAGEFLKETKSFIEDGISSHLITKGLRKACELAVKKIEEIQVEIKKEDTSNFRDLLERCAKTAMSSKRHQNSGANIVLSKLPIGDLATQYLPTEISSASASTVSGISEKDIGTCAEFEERQIGGDRYNLFRGCPEAKTCTLVLRGGAEQVIAEVERSLHDAIMIVKRAVKHHTWEYSKTVAGKQQLIIGAFARALEIIPRQLCENAGLDAIELLNVLRSAHAKGEKWYGIDFHKESVGNNMESFIWEPSLVKINALQSATEAATLLLSVDETIKNSESEQAAAGRGAY